MLRNPIDRIYSNFWMNIRQGNKNYQELTFDKFIDKGLWNTPINHYTENLYEWLKYIPLEQIFLIKSEEFFECPEEVLSELYNFLGIEKHIYSHRIHETPLGKKASQYPPMHDPMKKRLQNLFSYQQYHLLELTGRDFGWYTTNHAPEG